MSMSSNADATVSAVSCKGKWCKSRDVKHKDDVVYSCKRCGTEHKPKQCPAFGKQCAKCNGKNHFAKQCFSKAKVSKKERSVKMIEETVLSDTFFLGMVTCKNTKNNKRGQLSVNTQSQEDTVKDDKWMAPLKINGALVILKLDIGAKANLISISDINKMKEKPKI